MGKLVTGEVVLGSGGVVMGFGVLIELGELGVGITGFGKTELGSDEPDVSEFDTLTVPLPDEESVED